MYPNKNKDSIHEFLTTAISKNRKIGEYAGDSGHLSYISIVDIKANSPKHFKFQGNDALEISFMVETYTETEFLHSPEEDENYKHKYYDAIIYTPNYEILEYHKDVKPTS